jgi:hypothetical protein
VASLTLVHVCFSIRLLLLLLLQAPTWHGTTSRPTTTTQVSAAEAKTAEIP